ncbi:helix-turn-helix transcriptional regulator [Paenibacillus illinoisensis]|uniref:helix-turn-helix domain-containing protein n=1 Tax=Paenibacillus illinoisensis TaxID=59845 RepID=UPI00301C2305
MDFSKAVAEAMKRLKLRKADIAKSSGYSHQYISDLLSGDRRWNEDSINKVCGALGITIEIKQSDIPEALENKENDCLEV